MKRALWIGFAAAILAIPVATMVARAQRIKLPSYGPVPSFSLVDQEGQKFDRAQLAGKVWVADFVFTGCSEACPKLTGEMAKLQKLVLDDAAKNYPPPGQAPGR